MKNYFFVTACFVCTVFQSSAQWRDHLSFESATLVGTYGSAIYAGNDKGLFFYNLSDYSLQKMTKVNALSDVGISAVGGEGNTLLLGYENGNIDLINGGKVFNLPDLKNKNLSGSKKINHIWPQGHLYYCATDLGIVVVNTSKLEIADTYYLGSATENLAVYRIAIQNDTLYAATEKGIWMANRNQPALSYFGSWKEVTGNATAYSDLLFYRNQLWISRGKTGTTNSILQYDQGVWRTRLSVNQFRRLGVAGDSLCIVSQGAFQMYDSNFQRVGSLDKVLLPGQENPVALQLREGRFLTSGTMYILADHALGLVLAKPNGEAVAIKPNGPSGNTAFKIVAGSKGVYRLAGGLSSAWNNANTAAAYSFFDGKYWSSWARPSGKGWRDLINMAIHPQYPDSVYLSSWGDGVFKAFGTDSAWQYNQHNSGLRNIDWAGSNYVRVGAICYDQGGNLMMSNSEVVSGLVAKTPDGRWVDLSYPPTDNLHSMGQMICTRDNICWAIMPRVRQGLFVFSTGQTIDNSSDDRYRSVLSLLEDGDARNQGQLMIWDENREVITQYVYALAEDKSGYVWVGTDKGIVVYYRPWAIFDDTFPVASRIKVPRTDGTNLADHLLENEKVTCLAVDGANRKWIGTEKSGLFLVSEDGLKTIHSFKAQNSPLLSDNITSVAVHPHTGEVFIGTDKGMVSFQGDAIEAETQLKTIQIYPNPVRETFFGSVVLKGMTARANVKITDAAGNLVYETTSLGGQASWNLNNLRGQKVRTGVYLVWVVNTDGTESIGGKILVVR